MLLFVVHLLENTELNIIQGDVVITVSVGFNKHARSMGEGTLVLLGP